MERRPHYGCVIMFMAFLVMTTYGIFFSYGIFFRPMVNDFGWDRADTSTVFLIFMAVYTLSSIPMGWLFDKYGPRIPLCLAAVLGGISLSLCARTDYLWQLWLFFGLAGGASFGAVYVVPVSTVVTWFSEKRGLAVGIVVAGIGAGLAAVPPVAEGLISLYGWRMAFVILGIAYLIVLLIAASILRKNPELPGLKHCGVSNTNVDNAPPVPMGALPAQGVDLTVREAIKTRSFWMLYVSVAFAFGADTLAVVHIVPFAQDVGIASAVAAGTVTSMGIGNMAGRIGMGALSDRVGRRLILTVSCFLEGAAFLSLIWVGNVTALYLVVFATGFSFGGVASVFAPLVGEYFGFANMGKILGAAFSNGAVAGILGPWLGGYIFDVTGSYRWAFVTASATCFMAVGLSFLITSEVKKRPSSRVLAE